MFGNNRLIRLFGNIGLVVILITPGALAETLAGSGVGDESPYEPPEGEVEHREAPDDLPAAGSDRATATGARTIIERNGFVSVQVNVSPGGANIIGDAANEPSLAIDPNDPSRIAIGWRQFDSITSNFRQAGWAYSQDGGQTWTFPGVLEPGVFRSDPVLDFNADGTFYYCSLRTTFECETFRSVDGGQTWGAGVPSFGGDKQWITIDRTGGVGTDNLYVIWRPSFSPYTDGSFARSVDGGNSFAGPYPLMYTPELGTMSVGPNGTVYIAGAASSAWPVVARSTNAKYAGQTPTFQFSGIDLGGTVRLGAAPNPEGLLGQYWIATDHSGSSSNGNVYVLASVAEEGSADPLDVKCIRSTNGGISWSYPVRVNDDVGESWQWLGTLSVAPDGRLDAVWIDTRNSSGAQRGELYYAYSLDTGNTWSPNVPVTPMFNSHVGWPQQAKMGDYYDMISDNAAANLAYCATFNGEQDVYFVRLGDCNNNGVHDSEDLIGGTSDDINGNGLPDECEPDCNANGVPDDWDIALGTSVDCNMNSVPDECDLAGGTSEDCNANGVPDECDISAGTSVDCNDNNVPDVCDLAGGTSADCDGNGVPDECDIAADPSRDCNTNGVLDECDIAGGASLDCNMNGVPDECDLVAQVRAQSPQLAPLGGVTLTYVMPDARLALPDADIELSFEAIGDLNQSSELVDVYLNGVWVGDVYGEGVQTSDCSVEPIADSLVVGAGVFNQAASTGTVQWDFVPTALIEVDRCDDPTWLAVEVGYAAVAASSDCNANDVPDECDVAGGTSADSNGNGVPDECEICRGDCNCDGTVDFTDIMFFVAALSGYDNWVDYHLSQTGSAPTCPWGNCDANGVGGVAFDDIAPFADLIGQPCQP